jgi:glycine hydroxymethyltransferase
MNKVFNLIKKEEERQTNTLMMIPSENYTYPEVRRAVGSVLMQKYAEGQPGKRYYQGMKYIDEVELLCEKLALEAFHLDPDIWGVNVQPYSGSPANLEVYNALLTPGERILSMYLPEGGHLSHGWKIAAREGKPERKVTFVSKIWNVDFYHVERKSRIFDYKQIQKKAKEFKPKLIISGGTAYPREIDYKTLGEIARSVGAYYLADVAHEAGLIAAGVNKSPFAYADVVTMTTHKTLRGPRGAMIFSRKELSEVIDASVFPGIQGGPHINTIAGIAVALDKCNTNEFKIYAYQTVKNAQYLSRILSEYGFDIVSGGTDKHLIVIDLRNKNINGWFAAVALEYAGIIVNKNTVPFDMAKPFYPSGIRLGTPAISVRGMKEEQMKYIAEWIDQVVNHLGGREIPDADKVRAEIIHDFRLEMGKDKIIKEIALSVGNLCRKFPVPKM